MEEPSYFFRMGKFQQQILDHIAAHPEFVMPDVRRNEVIARLQKEPLRDLSVSRTTFSWGIAVPGNPDHVMYVWFDALTNYLTAAGFPGVAVTGTGGAPPAAVAEAAGGAALAEGPT